MATDSAVGEVIAVANTEHALAGLLIRRHSWGSHRECGKSERPSEGRDDYGGEQPLE